MVNNPESFTLEQCVTVYLLQYSFDNMRWEEGEAQLVVRLASLLRPSNPPSLGDMWVLMKSLYWTQYGNSHEKEQQ